MVSCKSCGTTKSKKITQQGISFHSFPRDKNLKQKWIRFVGEGSYKESIHSFLCSLHFEETCFSRFPEQKTMLRYGSVPTIYIGRIRYVSVNPKYYMAKEDKVKIKHGRYSEDITEKLNIKSINKRKGKESSNEFKNRLFDNNDHEPEVIIKPEPIDIKIEPNYEIDQNVMNYNSESDDELRDPLRLNNELIVPDVSFNNGASKIFDRTSSSRKSRSPSPTRHELKVKIFHLNSEVKVKTDHMKYLQRKCNRLYRRIKDLQEKNKSLTDDYAELKKLLVKYTGNSEK